MMRRGQLSAPFDRRPAEGPLETFPSWVASSNELRKAEWEEEESRTKEERQVAAVASAAAKAAVEQSRSRKATPFLARPSALHIEAEAQLGACRERCLELELKLEIAYDRVKFLGGELEAVRSEHKAACKAHKEEVRRCFRFWPACESRSHVAYFVPLTGPGYQEVAPPAARRHSEEVQIDCFSIAGVIPSSLPLWLDSNKSDAMSPLTDHHSPGESAGEGGCP